MVRQHESQWPDDVGSDLPEDFALDQRFADQPELVIFQIAQAAMYQFRRPRRGAAGQVIHFAEENRIPPARRIAGDTAAIDAAANDREVENLTQGRSLMLSCRARSRPRSSRLPHWFSDSAI